MHRGRGRGRTKKAMPGRGLASVLPTPKKRGTKTKSIYAGIESRRLCLCVGDPVRCHGEPYGLLTAFPNSPKRMKDRGPGFSLLKKRGDGGKKQRRKRSSPEKHGAARTLSPLKDLHHSKTRTTSSVAPSGRVAGPNRVAAFQSRDILTPYAPLSSLDPDARHESRRRGQAQQVFANEVKLQQMIDSMLNAAVQELPWQARACPQALECREAARLRAACRNEKRRVQEWRQLEQSRAMEAAEREDRRSEVVELTTRRRAQTAFSKEQQHTRSYEQRRKGDIEMRWKEHVNKVEYWRGIGRHQLLLAENEMASRSREAEMKCLISSQFHPEALLAVLDVVNPTDKEGLRAINRAASHLENRIIASAWLVILAAERRNQFLDRKELQWRCGERAALAARLRASAKIEAIASFEAWKVERVRVTAADEEEQARVANWEQLHDAAMRCAQDSLQKMLQQPEHTPTIEMAEQKERITWFASAIASRARAERDTWIQHRTDSQHQARAVREAWEMALQKWRKHSEESATRRIRELEEWLHAHYSDEEETVAKGCAAMDAAQRKVREETEKTEARQFDYEVTARMEILTVRSWSLEEWQQERFKAHAFSEKIRQSVLKLWTTYNKDAADAAKAERSRADETLSRIIETWLNEVRAAVKRVCIWQARRIGALHEVAQQAILAASSALGHAVDHAADPEDVEPTFKKISEDIRALHANFESEERSVAEEEISIIREELSRAAAHAHEERQQALARAKMFRQEQVRALEEASNEAANIVSNGYAGATRRAVVFEESHEERLEAQLRNLLGRDAMVEAAAERERRKAAIKLQSIARQKQATVTSVSMVPKSAVAEIRLSSGNDTFNDEDPDIEESVQGGTSNAAFMETGNEENIAEAESGYSDFETDERVNGDDDYDFGNEKNFVELETTTARDVGRPVSIWWDEEAEAFDGVIESFEPGKGWFIVYDDGDEEWNAGPVRVRFRDREPQEKVLKQKLQKVGQSNSSPKREDTTQALTQPASHHKLPISDSLRMSSSRLSLATSEVSTVMQDTDVIDPVEEWLSTEGGDQQESRASEEGIWHPKETYDETASSMDIATCMILNSWLAEEMRVVLTKRSRDAVRSELLQMCSEQSERALRDLKEAEEHIKAAVLADEEEKDGDSSDSKETYEQRAVRQLQEEQEGPHSSLHGARAERRCLRELLSLMEARLQRNLKRAEAALGTRTLKSELRREFAALSEIVEASLEANQDLRDTWGRLRAELGETLRREKKGQLGDLNVVRGFVKVAIQKGNDSLFEILHESQTTFDAMIIATEKKREEIRSVNETAVTNAAKAIEEGMEVLKATLTAGLARGEQLFAAAKESNVQTSAAAAAQAQSLREEAAQHHGMMSSHKSKAEREILNLQLSAAKESQNLLESTATEVAKLKTRTEKEGLDAIQKLKSNRTAANRAQEAHGKEMLASSATAIESAISDLRTSSKHADVALSIVAAELQESLEDRTKAASSEFAKRDISLASKINQWFESAKKVTKGSNNKQGVVKRERDLAHSRKVAERTAKEQRGSLLLIGVSSAVTQNIDEEEFQAERIHLEPVLEVWGGSDSAQQDRQIIVSGCSAVERDLVSRGSDCWNLIEKRFQQLKNESEGLAAANMSNMKSTYEKYACAAIMESILVKIDLQQSIIAAKTKHKGTITKGFAALVATSEEKKTLLVEKDRKFLDSADDALEAALGPKIRASKLKVEGTTGQMIALGKQVAKEVAKATLKTEEASIAMSNAKRFSPFKRKLTAKQKAERIAALLASNKTQPKLKDVKDAAERRDLAARILTGWIKRTLIRWHMNRDRSMDMQR